MLNWIFKKVVNLREKVAVDLGAPDQEKPFLDHLDDLRKMIVNMVITLLVVTLVTFVYCKELLEVIKYPLVLAGLQDKINLIALKPTAGFMTAMNISLVAGVILAFPVLLYFLLQFVLPGLRTSEKKVIFPALAVGGGLFLLGVVFAFYVVAPRALTFFYEFGVDFIHGGEQTDGKPPPIYPWEIVEYVKFICQFVLIFGACFELPVVVMALVKMDVLNYRVMKTSRAWAAVIIAVVAAVITPTQDALTLGLLAVPMYALYEICIWLAYYLEKKDRQLYPEYYKEMDEESKAVEVADDWDNENYNPWGSDDDEEEEDGGADKAKKLTTAKAEDTAAVASTGTAAAIAETREPHPPVTSDEPSGSSSEVTSKDGPVSEPESEPVVDAPSPTLSLDKDHGSEAEPSEPTADKRDTD